MGCVSKPNESMNIPKAFPQTYDSVTQPLQRQPRGPGQLPGLHNLGNGQKAPLVPASPSYHDPILQRLQAHVQVLGDLNKSQLQRPLESIRMQLPTPTKLTSATGVLRIRLLERMQNEFAKADDALTSATIPSSFPSCR